MRRTQLVIFAVAALAPLVAGAEQVRNPDWLRRPSSEDLLVVWPREAWRKGKGGKATIACIATVQGVLRACEVASESPAGAGFGGAALALSRQFVMKPALLNGVPVEATVRIPINFESPGGETGSYLRPSGNPVYAQLPWRKAPTVAEVLAAYPAKARAANVGGTVVLDCKITEAGGLSNCRTIRDDPDGFGFASAARGLTDRFETPTRTDKDESIVGGRAHVTIAFSASSLTNATPAIGKPKWVAGPRVNDIAAVMPAAAKAAKVYAARVVMDCTVVANGLVDGCKVASQDPAGLGYDTAALSLTRYFALAVWTEEGLPTVGGAVRIPLRFDFEAAMKAAAPPPKP